jgi:hypothetical protein
MYNNWHLPQKCEKIESKISDVKTSLVIITVVGHLTCQAMQVGLLTDAVLTVGHRDELWEK